MKGLSRPWQIFWLAVLTAGYVLTAPILALAAVMSPILFEREGGLFNPLAWLAFVLTVTLWVTCLAAPFAAWVLFLRGYGRMAWIIMAAPAAWAGLIAILLAVI